MKLFNKIFKKKKTDEEIASIKKRISQLRDELDILEDKYKVSIIRTEACLLYPQEDIDAINRSDEILKEIWALEASIKE